MGQVSLRGIRKRFGTVDVIRGIGLEVRDGKYLVFVGPSGCGKSTTLRMIAGIAAMTLGNRIAVFNQGVVEQIGAPMALDQRTGKQFVANFIGAPRINPVDRPGTGAPAARQAPWTAPLGASAMSSQRG